MLFEQTMAKMSELRLHGMLKQMERLKSHQGDQPLDVGDAIGLLVDAEQTYRDNNKLSGRLRKANFKYKNAALEDVMYRPGRGFAKSTISDLRSSRWVSAHKTIVLAGATGAGKTWLSCALGHQACRDGFSVLYKRTNLLLQELDQARAEGSYPAALKALSKADVIVLDDFCMSPLSATERRDLLEVLEDRYGTAATVIASQLDPDQWHAAIGDATFADSICDRLVHGAHRLHMKGEFIRKVLAEEASPTASDAA